MKTSDTPRSISLKDQLRNEAKSSHETFDALLGRYVRFRLLYRISRSKYADRFLLKGANMFLFWTGSMHRPTTDIDLLDTVADDAELKGIFSEIAALPCERDCVSFDPNGITSEPIRVGAPHGGTRLRFFGNIGNSRVRIQIDIAIGDPITPGAEQVEIPAIVKGVPTGILRCYNPETAFAEKYEAMTRLGLATSRMKDFFDLAILIHNKLVDKKILTSAIAATFAARGAPVPVELPMCLTSTFWLDPANVVRWEAFTRKNKIESPFNDLGWVCKLIAGAVAT